MESHIHGLVQDCGIFSANALGIPQPCTEPRMTLLLWCRAQGSVHVLIRSRTRVRGKTSRILYSFYEIKVERYIFQIFMEIKYIDIHYCVEVYVFPHVFLCAHICIGLRILIGSSTNCSTNYYMRKAGKRIFSPHDNIIIRLEIWNLCHY